jgi:proline iminopeptidase
MPDFKQRLGLYPEIEPFHHDRLQVDSRHTLYYEQCGNPDGKPVVMVHGGPGGGCSPGMRRFHDPAKYRIVLFDQRGAGRSTPHADLVDNTTWDLVADMERLRQHLGIQRWQVFGGSWGSTLALAYAQSHPDRVSELVLRGIFMLRRWELEWFYQEGASRLFPDAWERYLAAIPAVERGDLISAFHRRLTCADPQQRVRAARAWSVWEAATSFLHQDPQFMAAHEADDFALAFARIESHYFVNGGFFEVEDQLLRDVPKIRHLPATIVHGRYDVVCPLQNAWDLHRAWPEAQLEIVSDAGHSAFEPGNVDALVRATDHYRELA